MIASHYAEPLDRRLAASAGLRGSASEDAAVICDLPSGAPFALLDDSLGWAWGYAGNDRQVGYVPSDALAPY